MSTLKECLRRVTYAAVLAVSPSIVVDGAGPELAKDVYIVPNFHPASSGWLANWSSERNYCANTYLLHLDRVRDDANYRFVLSECNNLIAMLNFAPERFAELKSRVGEGRVELVNGFFIESTMSLGGGEVYAKMGVEGMRWQEQMLGRRPRFAWCIDICGTPDQLAQISAQLGLEALVFTRNNRKADEANAFWSQAPDGTRLLTVAPNQYSDFGPNGIGLLFGEPARLTEAQLQTLETYFAERVPATPADAPVLVLGGKGDYSRPPARQEQPTEFLEQWRSFRPGTRVRVSTFAEYVDALKPVADTLITQPAGTSYGWNAFWVQNPTVKSWFRRSEHVLQAAETAATLASLRGDFVYPVGDLYHGWLQMFLNADRNTLWGAAGGMVFEHPTSWDARDRFQWVEDTSRRITQEAMHAIAPQGHAPGFFNALSWDRHDPVDGRRQVAIGAYATVRATRAASLRPLAEVPAVIETRYYTATIDPGSGDLLSLRAKPSGRELLGGRANVLVAEKGLRPTWYQAGDNLLLRPERPRLAASSDFGATVRAMETDVAVVVEVASTFFGGGPARRVVRFNKDYPRIDFETELEALPDETVVVSEFPLAAMPVEIRRGVPFGFSHGTWPEIGMKPHLDGWTQGILPAVRWSDYELPGGGGLALLDRGLPGREITGQTPVLFLCSTVEKYYGYPNAWLSGKARQRFQYALAVRDTPWAQARIPRMAWEYNCPPIPVQAGCEPTPPTIRTSENLIVEVMRRDGADIELRLIECLGVAGAASVTVDLPHGSAALTDFHGNHVRPLVGGPGYEFPVRPQEIITMRLRTAAAVPAIEPLTDWSSLVPEQKRAALKAYLPDVVGHPPRGD
jgi:alpha-mannosidase